MNLLDTCTQSWVVNLKFSRDTVVLLGYVLHRISVLADGFFEGNGNTLAHNKRKLNCMRKMTFLAQNSDDTRPLYAWHTRECENGDLIKGRKFSFEFFARWLLWCARISLGKFSSVIRARSATATEDSHCSGNRPRFELCASELGMIANKKQKNINGPDEMRTDGSRHFAEDWISAVRERPCPNCHQKGSIDHAVSAAILPQNNVVGWF